MWHHYSDITSRIPELPRWWDERAVPRYVVFSPEQVANIYADQVALVQVACQNCAREFYVAMSWRFIDTPSLSARILDHSLDYGDPPNAGCCPSGPSMNSVPMRVLEFWGRSRSGFNWERHPQFEIPLEQDWTRQWKAEHHMHDAVLKGKELKC